jgi:hypothetical protein
VTLNDLVLSKSAVEVRESHALLAELAGKGDLDKLWDNWKAIRDAADRAMNRIGQIENGL